jgi:hypothetical protein
MIEGALTDFWKLKAIDSLDSSMQVGALPQEERNKILDALIDNRQNKRNNPPTKNEIVSVLILFFH